MKLSNSATQNVNFKTKFGGGLLKESGIYLLEIEELEPALSQNNNEMLNGKFRVRDDDAAGLVLKRKLVATNNRSTGDAAADEAAKQKTEGWFLQGYCAMRAMNEQLSREEILSELETMDEIDLPQFAAAQVNGTVYAEVVVRLKKDDQGRDFVYNDVRNFVMPEDVEKADKLRWPHSPAVLAFLSGGRPSQESEVPAGGTSAAVV